MAYTQLCVFRPWVSPPLLLWGVLPEERGSPDKNSGADTRATGMCSVLAAGGDLGRGGIVSSPLWCNL